MNSIAQFRSLLIALLVAVAQMGPGHAAPVLERVANTTLQMPQVPRGFGFRTENAFGNLTFAQPVAAKTPPGETNRLFVVEQTGRIYVLTNLAVPNKTLFLDLSKQTLVSDGDGLFALAFHPGFATNGQFFTGRTLNTKTDATGAHYRVSRFSVSAANPNFASTNSELPLVTQRGAGPCDDMSFGPDGYLYISVIDPGAQAGGGPSANRIDLDLFSGILRIDVDKRSGNLAPNAHPATSTNYLIPSDNPFVEAASFNGLPVDPLKVRTEFYAVGLRNPWRMSFDELTGLLYVGDPGNSSRDEINVVVKGGNYGWPFREGTGAGPASAKTPPGFVSINPIHQYNNPSAIIGGLVYRGQLYPNLDGAYIFGDYVKSQIYALHYSGANLAPSERLCSSSGVTAFSQDPRNGAVLTIGHDQGRIARLVYSTNAVGTPLPPTLAETGAFADLSSLTPNPGIVSYDLNVPFWSDNAHKTRWFSVPDLKQTITFNSNGNWQFPTGAVWIKHFELELTNGVASSSKRLETRLLVRTATGVYGATYRWGDFQNNATLVDENGLDEPFEIHEGGMVRTQIWHYPARSECATCHTPIAGLALGFNTTQLNRDHNYGGLEQNQLAALSEAGYFSTNVTQIDTLPSLAPASATTASLEHRARSYLAANCVQCHQPGGASRGRFDTRISTPLSESGLIDGSLVNSLGDAQNRVIAPGDLSHSALFSRVATLGAEHMPPLATSVLNSEAIELLSIWITRLPSGDLLPPSLQIQLTTDRTQAEIRFIRPANRVVEIHWTSDLSQANSWNLLDRVGNQPDSSTTATSVTILDPLAPAASKFYRARAAP